MTFRLTLTAWVMLMIGALAALLILVQDRTLKLATEETAKSTMDGVSARTTTLLREQIANLARATRTLSISPSLTEPSELDVGSPALPVQMIRLPASSCQHKNRWPFLPLVESRFMHESEFLLAAKHLK